MIIILTDILKKSIDEGARVATFHLMEVAKRKYNCILVSINGDKNLPIIDRHFRTNKLFLSSKLYRYLKTISFSDLLYIPEASVTTNTFMRAKVLNYFTGKRVSLLAFQPRQYGIIAKQIFPFVKIEKIVTQSDLSASQLQDLGFQTFSLPLGVNESKFRPYDDQQIKRLKNFHNIPLNSKVILHVGHIRTSRNLAVLLEVKHRLPEVYPIVIGSTFSPLDQQLYNKLTSAGIRVIREFIPEIQDFYNMADFYIFPVLKNDGAIETPLSVLEAMACNISVITTRFGSLPDVFTEDSHFRFFDSIDSLVALLREDKKDNCNNRSKVKKFTWEAIAKELVTLVGNSSCK